MSQPRHRRGTKHVQDHLLRCPRLQPRRTRQHFRPHLRRNHDFRQPPHRHPQVGRHRHCRCSELPGMLQGAQDVRRRPARRDSHHHVVPRQLLCAQIAFPVPRRILRPFHGMRNRAPPSGDQRLHHLWRRPKRRRTFGRIQNSHPPARSRSNIKQPPALSNAVHDRVYSSPYRRQLSTYCDRHLAVFAIHQPHNLDRRHAVEMARRHIPVLGEPRIDKPIFFRLLLY